MQAGIDKNNYCNKISISYGSSSNNENPKRKVPDDPLKSPWVNMLSYSNEVGSALALFPGGKKIEQIMWAPALMYLGADIYDKYARGKNGDYEKPSTMKLIERAFYQIMYGFVLTTAAVKIGQSLAGQALRLSKDKLSSSAQIEVYKHIHKSFEEGMFKEQNTSKLKEDIISKFKYYLDNSIIDLSKEKPISRVKRFFTGTDAPMSSAAAGSEKVLAFMSRELDKIIELKGKLEPQNLESLKKDKKLYKKYQKLIKKLGSTQETTRKMLGGFIKGKIMGRTHLKTLGGFVTLATVAVPMNYICEQYFIKKFVHPGLERANAFVQDFPQSFNISSEVFNIRRFMMTDKEHAAIKPVNTEENA